LEIYFQFLLELDFNYNRLSGFTKGSDKLLEKSGMRASKPASAFQIPTPDTETTFWFANYKPRRPQYRSMCAY